MAVSSTVRTATVAWLITAVYYFYQYILRSAPSVMMPELSSAFGLTAAIWTRDEEAAIAIGDQVETGTWFMNRCDYLDPALAWTGVKDSGRGCSLSRLGYDALTRPKSFHLRVHM